VKIFFRWAFTVVSVIKRWSPICLLLFPVAKLRSTSSSRSVNSGSARGHRPVLRDEWRPNGFSGVDLANAVQDILAGRVFQQIRFRTALILENIFVAIEGRQDNDRAAASRSRICLRAPTRPVRHPKIQERNVRTMPFPLLDGLAAV